MLRSAKQCKEYGLGALDGHIGHVRDLYFDDSHWTVRYVVAQAGNWLTGRMVLLSPFALGTPDDEGKVIPVNLTREQIRNGPSPETDRPVSRQFEMDYYRFYGWPYYWGGPYLWGPYPFPVLGATDLEGYATERKSEPGDHADPHLRSCEEAAGYHLHARDGEIGHIEDFLYGDKDWSLRYLVAGTRNWWPGERVIVPVEWVKNFHWEDRKVDVDAGRDEIRHSPHFDPDQPIDPELEEQLARYYETGFHRA